MDGGKPMKKAAVLKTAAAGVGGSGAVLVPGTRSAVALAAAPGDAATRPVCATRAIPLGQNSRMLFGDKLLRIELSP
jgi:hypothetical protein